MNSEWVTSQRILILAPAARAADWGQGLSQAGLDARICADEASLLRELEHHGAAAVLLAIECENAAIRRALEQQPAWSELPLVVIGDGAPATRAPALRLPADLPLTNLVSLVAWSLRARLRQYELRQLQGSLKRIHEQVDKARVAKSQFLANMSHEIRTPIGAIMGFAELAASPNAIPEERATYLDAIQRNSRQLLELVDDILDLSKVEAGHLDIERARFRPVDFMIDFVNTARPKALEKNLEFVLEYRTELPELITSDAVRLRQILWNLVGNAIKFTAHGRITLTVSYAGNGALDFTVADTGIGISEAQRPHLFQPFAQADASSTRRYGGTGLGLALSRRLAEALGGDLELQASQVGLGSEFRVRIDAAPPEGTRLVRGNSGTAPAEEGLEGLNVLLVEDSIDNQVLLAALLRRHGAHIEIRENGAEGSDAALSGTYDVVLMDVQMPVMDGHMATRKLRRLKYEKPIIALTAHALNEERIRCLASGFSDYLTKPVQMPVLLSVLNRYKTNSNRPKIPG